MFERIPDRLNLLNAMLKENTTWSDFATAVDTVVRRVITEPRWKLQRIRRYNALSKGDFFDTYHGRGKVSFIRKVFDRVDENGKPSFIDDVEIDLGNGLATIIPMRSLQGRAELMHNSSQLGFDYFSDKISDADYARIMRFISKYWPESGNDNFIKFLSYVKNIRLEMFQLFTPDYGDPDTDTSKDKYLYLERFNSNWEEKTYDRADFDWSKSTPEDGFGGVYPTSHVEIEYDVIKYANPDFNDLTHLFYFMAPIHLVLERYVSAVYSPPFSTYQGSAGSIDIMQHGKYEWKPDAEINAKSNLVASLDIFQGAMLSLDSNFNSLLPIQE